MALNFVSKTYVNIWYLWQIHAIEYISPDQLFRVLGAAYRKLINSSRAKAVTFRDN